MNDFTPQNALAIWVIYDHPKDHPDHWVVRRQFVVDGKVIPDDYVRLCTSVELARKQIPQGLICICRSYLDDPVIVESWM